MLHRFEVGKQGKSSQQQLRVDSIGVVKTLTRQLLQESQQALAAGDQEKALKFADGAKEIISHIISVDFMNCLRPVDESILRAEALVDSLIANIRALNT